MRRVAVTGMEAITPYGIGLDVFWEQAVAGKSGIGPLTLFDASAFPVRIAGQVPDWRPEEHFSSRDVKKYDRFIQFALVAAKGAWKASGLCDNPPEKDRAGVFIGSSCGGLRSIELAYADYLERGPRNISAFLIPSVLINLAAGQISISLGIEGPNCAVSTACASGNHAIGEAMRLITRGDAEVMMAGGTEATLTPLGVGGFANMKALSRRNEEPSRASRPFDRDRDGFVCAEGAGMLVLEEWEHARKRGAVILGELLGYAHNADGHHITAPSPGGAGAAACMNLALKDAGINAEEVGYINAHGTSTPQNDATETTAIKTVFGSHASAIPISSTKSLIGHAFGAAGALEAIATLMMLRKRVLWPTINLENPDPECDLDYIPEGPREVSVKVAVSNAFGFGGTNAVLVLGRGE